MLNNVAEDGLASFVEARAVLCLDLGATGP